MDSHEITRALQRWPQDPTALEPVFHAIQQELEVLAKAQLAGKKRYVSLATQDLIGEACLKLLKAPNQEWHSRKHFYVVCAKIIRATLINYLESKYAQKRNPGSALVTLNEAAIDTPEKRRELIALNGALQQLEAHSQRMAWVVELKYFAGFAEAEIAEILHISVPTVQRDWRFARAFLAGIL